MNKQHLLLIDGMALLFRAFYATSVRKQYMYNTAGLPTNAVQGYMRHLLIAIENVSPTDVAVCWDMGSVTFRNDIYKEYKSNRAAPPIEMVPQFDLAKEVTTAFGIPNIGVPGFEADDCIGTICNLSNDKMKMTVLTGDRDILQLLDQHVDVLIMQKGMGNYQKYTQQNFSEEYKITPRQLIDVKALMGDPSDGYPGVKGIGEKTAFRLIEEYGDLEGLLDNLANLTLSQRNRIEADLEMLHLCRVLAEIKCDVPLQLDFTQTIWGELPQTALEVLHHYELKTVRNHFVKNGWQIEAEELPKINM